MKEGFEIIAGMIAIVTVVFLVRATSGTPDAFDYAFHLWLGKPLPEAVAEE